MSARLTMMVDGREQTIELDKSVTTFGRASDNDVVINHIALSRRHAEIRRRSEGGYELLDKGSQNGVFVDDERIAGPYPLEDGNRIKLGSFAMAFSAVNGGQARRSRRRSPRSSGVGQPMQSSPTHPLQEERAFREPSRQSGMPSSTPNALESLQGPSRASAPPAASASSSSAPEADDPPTSDGSWERASEEVTPVSGFTRATSAEPESTFVVLTYNELEVQRFPLEKTKLLIGRAKDCDIQIPERRLSRKHCKLLRSGEVWRVVDMGSHNGTYVNRCRLPQKGQQELKPGDVLNFAEYAVLFQPLDQPESANLPAIRIDSAISFEETQMPPQKESKTPPPPLPEEAPKLDESAFVPDPSPPPNRPDSALDEWYDQRSQSDEDEPASLGRSRSTLSQALETMMVDRKELLRNLEVERKRRQFSLRIEWNGEILHEGPITNDVTILGEASQGDLPLRGRYVTGRHSLLVRVRDSLLFVRLGSSSVARVNGQPRLQSFLKDGDTVQIDETRIDVIEG